jgi:hypothetical protein
LKHHGKHGSTTKNRTQHIHLEGAHPVEDVDILKGTNWPVNPSVVHENIDSGVSVYGTPYHLVHLGWVG